jgi:hypothetical protein
MLPNNGNKDKLGEFLERLFDEDNMASDDITVLWLPDIFKPFNGCCSVNYTDY